MYNSFIIYFFLKQFKNYYPIIVKIDSYNGINLYRSQPIVPQKGVAIKITLNLPLQVYIYI